jgi:hypothetical protein
MAAEYIKENGTGVNVHIPGQAAKAAVDTPTILFYTVFSRN